MSASKAEKRYRALEKKAIKNNDYETFVEEYRLFKKNFSIDDRWWFYEDFVKYLIRIERYEEALKEWTILQEEEWTGWDRQFTYRPQSIQMLAKLETLVKRKVINGYYVHKMASKGSQLTAFGKRNFNDVMRTLDVIIKNEYQISFFEDFWEDYNFEENSFRPYKFEHYKRFFNYSPKIWKRWESVFNDNVQHEFHKKDKQGLAKTDLILCAIDAKCSFLLREAENKYRLSIGAKKIGESWISETELFYKLKKSLKEEVIHHGRPEWLGRQHFDIWIPELNVAIEYQGKQHDQPVDFFGGEEAFKENQKRDARKKKKCEENNVRLIEIREGYDLDELINQILN